VLRFVSLRAAAYLQGKERMLVLIGESGNNHVETKATCVNIWMRNDSVSGTPANPTKQRLDRK